MVYFLQIEKKELLMFLLFLFSLLLISSLSADTIIVDCNGMGDFLTIQEGIDFAVEGDTVLVLPCTYYENIFFQGKNIVLISRDGPDVTIIDGNGADYVAEFDLGIERSCVIEGFTITNGDYGIYCSALSSGAPSIIGNIIRDNNCGIYFDGDGGIIDGNIIRDNKNYGGGILFGGYGKGAVIKNNIIYNNIAGLGYGGGICLWISPPSLVANNLIYNN
jgi:parallel beta-helix repeat protein